MTARRPTPKHGTVARYRREIAEQKTGAGKGPCDRCRTANSARAKNARANKTALDRRSQMSIVEPVTDEGHADPVADHDTDPDPVPEFVARRHIQKPHRTVGEMELAVTADIDEIDSGLQVPFHRSLTVLALQLAREVDEPSTPATVRSQSSRQLFEVLKSLRTQREGDDNSAVAVALQAAGFGLPLVP